MRLGKRIWRTADGRLVLDGDPAAAFLVYGEGDDVPESIAAELTKPDVTDDADESEDVKMVKPGANKARKPGPNKGA